jgi:hypothetical protein
VVGFVAEVCSERGQFLPWQLDQLRNGQDDVGLDWSPGGISKRWVTSATMGLRVFDGVVAEQAPEEAQFSHDRVDVPVGLFSRSSAIVAPDP